MRHLEVARLVLVLLPPLTCFPRVVAWASDVHVAAGDDLQAALNAAQSGDTLRLAAGATFVGPFTLPNKAGTAVVTVRTDAPDASLPAPGARVDPSYAPVLPKLVSPGLNQSVLSTAPGAHHWRLLGLEVCPASDSAFVSELIQLGDGGPAQADLSIVPHDLILDRCYVHGTPGNGTVVRGVSLQSASTTVQGCWISDVHAVGQDTQAICGWNGPGPYTVDNCELQAAGENVMFGGADPSILGLVPSDITFTRNHVYKPLSWRVGDPYYAGTHWSVKTLFEVKNARRVLIDGNVFENCWADAQTGNAFNLKAVEAGPGGAPWSACDDVTLTNNVVRHVGVGAEVSGQTNRVNRLTVRNNLWVDVSTSWGGTGRWLAVVSNSDAVTVDHNTALGDGSSPIYGTDYPNTNFTCTNNVCWNGAYGVGQTWFPSAVWAQNVFVGGTTYDPPGSLTPVDWSGVGFVDLAGGDYHLRSDSPYHGAATDGTDVGYHYPVPTPPTLYSVRGTATLSAGGPLPGVVVTAAGQTVTTAADGTYGLTGLVAGAYSVFASRPDYALAPAVVSVTVGPDALGVDFVGTYVPPPDTTPPTCVVTAPSNGYHLNAPVLKVAVTASDSGGVTRVEVLLDGVVQVTLTTAPYTASLNVKRWAFGAHALTGRAYDAAGNVGTSTTVTVYR